MRKQKENGYFHFEDKNLVNPALQHEPEWKEQEDAAQRV